MARKISIRFNGKIIDTRKTDRTYTHAIVLTNFDPAVARAIDDRAWRKHGADNARAGHRHATEAQHTTYRYACVTSDAQRARYAEVAAMPVEDYVAKCHAERLQRLEAEIARRISVGAEVLSYCGRHDLALKAQAKAAKDHPAYTAVIAPVDA